MKVFLEKEVELRAEISFGEKCSNPACNLWHPPVCYNYKSKSGCTYGEHCKFRHVEVDGQPSKKSKKSVGKGSVALLKESTQLGYVSHDSHPRRPFLRKEGEFGSNRTVKSPQLWS